MVLALLRQDSRVAAYGLSAFYRHLGISRQGAHQLAKRTVSKGLLLSQLEALVVAYRRDKDSRAGSRSLFYNLNIKSRFGIGVNKFERLLREAGLLLSPLNKRVVTTQSCLQSWNYENLISGLSINGIEQVVVGDLTYLDLDIERYYLFMLTDAYSNEIVGHRLSKRCRADEALCALNVFLGTGNEARRLVGCIHHTDGGTQYFSHLYQTRLKSGGLRISVADNCLQNGLAEQKNGLIKNHFLETVDWRIVDDKVAKMAELIYRHNYERKQEKLGWMTPWEYGQAQRLRANPVVKVLHKW